MRFNVEFMDAPYGDPKAKEYSEAIEAALRETVEQTTEPFAPEKWLIVYVSDMPSAPGEDYLIRLVAIAYEEQVGVTEPLACVACGPDELTATARRVLPSMLEALAAAEPPPVLAPAPEPAQAEPEAELGPALSPAPKARTLQIAGIVTAATGGIMLGTGAALLGVGQVYPRDAPNLYTEFVNYTPPGAVLAGVGGAMLVTGLVCWGLGVRKPAALVGVAPVLNRYAVGGSVAFAF